LKSKLILTITLTIATIAVAAALIVFFSRGAKTIHVFYEFEYTQDHNHQYEYHTIKPYSPAYPPPTATPVNTTIPMGQEISPLEMLTDITYTTPIKSILFINEPYLFICGEQALEIEITDQMGNILTIPATLTILPNEEPPVIIGVEDMVVRRFGTLLLRQNVTAYDAFGNALDFNVNSQYVDVETPGVYQITYYAYDRWGNRTEVFAHVIITDVDTEWVYNRADEILAEITSPDATQVEQAQAIFTWMRRNMTYAATIGRTGRYENAYQGLRHRRGNCFVYYYTAEIMLTRIGIPNRRIDRYGGATNHRWHLINPDGLGWHHLDTGPQSLVVAGRFSTFMFTSSQAAEFTAIIYNAVGRHSHYVYDKELHPDIVY